MNRQIVFDFGAVLFQWQPQELIRARLADRAPDAAAARALADAIFKHADWQAFDSGLLSQDEVVERSAARLALPAGRLGSLVGSIPEHLMPIEPTLELLAGLKARRERDPGLRLYFLSNMPVPFARALERRHAFLSWFDGGTFSGDVRLAKPDPAIFALAESRHQLVAATTLFIDDHLDNVRAARSRGWSAIHCLSPANLHAEVLSWLG